MRICHVIESASCGSANIMLQLAEYAVREGDDVTVIYSPLRASNEFLEHAHRIGLAKLMAVPMHRAVGLHDAAAVARLRRIFGSAGFDVVHSHSSKAGALARLAGIGVRSAQVYSPHGFVTMSGTASPVYRVIERVLSPLCDAIIAVSEKERQHAVGLGIAQDKVHVVANGIAESAVASSCPGGHEGFTIGFVGRLSDQKNPVLAVEAFARFHRARPDSRLVMIGEGDLADAVSQAVHALGLVPFVELAGHAPAMQRYPGFDVLLCSSRYEGMPVTFLEALANGVPLIATDVGGVDELITPGETGFVAENTAEGLSGALETLAGLNPGRRDRIRQECLARARTFSSRAMFENTRALYARVLASRSSSPRRSVFANKRQAEGSR